MSDEFKTKGRQTLKLRVDARGQGRIAIDDVDISNSVTGVELKTDVEGVNTVTVRFVAVNLDVEADVSEVHEEQEATP